MTTDIHPIQAAAIALADSRNHLAVAAACESPACYTCNYSQNVAEFADVLRGYTMWRIRHHRILNKVWGFYDREDMTRFGGYEKVHSKLMEAANALDKLWPCPSCVERFNPTGRKRSRYGGRRRNRPWGQQS